jgi:hypothetical protein
LTTVSDAPSCGITYNRRSDDCRGVIYGRNIFMMEAQVGQMFFDQKTRHFSEKKIEKFVNSKNFL